MSVKNWEGTKNRFNVSDIITKIRGVNYLSKFYFEIENSTNNFVEDLLKDAQSSVDNKNMISRRDIFFYSQGITIPSRGINTEEYIYSNGYRIEVPTGTNFGDGNINIPIIVDDKYTLYEFFISWMDRIHSKETGFFTFHDDYTTNVNIKQLDYKTTSVISDSIDTFHNNMAADNGFFVYGIKLINCYPKAVSAIEFRHDSKEKVEFNVNLSYEGINYLKPS